MSNVTIQHYPVSIDMKATSQGLKTHLRPPAQRYAAAAILAAVILCALAIAAAQMLQSRQSAGDEDENASAVEGTQAVVTLSEEKLRSAELHFAQCEMRELSEMRTVPGKITYNETRRLEVKSPVEGVVKRVLVAQEQTVRKGEQLCVISSPEIGLARDELKKAQADLAIAEKEADRNTQIAANVDKLIALVQMRPDPRAVKKDFDQQLLGKHRDTILSAYSKLVLADAVAAASQGLEESRTISGRVAQQRKSDREIATAAFQSACEQSKFEAEQDRDKARALAQHYERLLSVYRVRLHSLGATDADSEGEPSGDQSDLVLRAPFDGVITERWVVDAAHLSVGERLFLVADTATLWASAELFERDWNALAAAGQSDLRVQVPDLLNGKVVARVKFTAGKVSPETRTVAVVGELDNTAKQLRPGMFAWVTVALSKPRQALAVPAAAIVRHEQSPFVFLAQSNDTFRRVDVVTGLETPDFVEIKAGLSAGQSVVDRGTFYLKSELLLEREVE